MNSTTARGHKQVLSSATSLAPSWKSGKGRAKFYFGRRIKALRVGYSHRRLCGAASCKKMLEVEVAIYNAIDRFCGIQNELRKRRRSLFLPAAS